jgi:hypothetical protein
MQGSLDKFDFESSCLRKVLALIAKSFALLVVPLIAVAALVVVLNRLEANAGIAVAAFSLLAAATGAALGGVRHGD